MYKLALLNNNLVGFDQFGRFNLRQFKHNSLLSIEKKNRVHELEISAKILSESAGLVLEFLIVSYLLILIFH